MRTFAHEALNHGRRVVAAVQGRQRSGDFLGVVCRAKAIRQPDTQAGVVKGHTSGLVDLPAVVDMLYTVNPNINLNIEDSGGFIAIPLYDEALLQSFTDRTPARLARFMHYLWRGDQQVRAGLHLRPEE